MGSEYARAEKIRDERKHQIKSEYKEKMGLLVDVVRQGFGTYNDGNTARRCFSNAELFAEITGIQITLIKKFHNILQVISAPYAIVVNKFQECAFNTAKYFVEYYGWFYMPASVHKLLIHGKEIINHALLPIVQLSEEAQETKHKGFKHFRTYNSRKNARITTNGDTFYRLLLTSDPHISSLTIKSSTKKPKPLDPEAADMLLQ